MNVNTLLDKQRSFFEKGMTFDLKFRKQMLKKLYDSIKQNEDNICDALKIDLGKDKSEAYMCEIGMALSEISFMMKNLKKYASKRKAKTPLAQFPSKSYQIAVPYGNVLIMSPWNYPFLLTIGPLANAIAAGNTAIIKPSAYSAATSELIRTLITKAFPDEYIAVVNGGRKENASLLSMKFDFIFFTGSQNVGKEVLRNAAERLTPVVLELGGKSPCIVDETAKIKIAAKRIVFGKLLNCGQTCVAPDYILCHNSVKEELINEICSQITEQYGKDPLLNDQYGKIINEKHFDRIMSLISTEKIVLGGESDRASLRIAPTVMSNVTFSDPVMQEEIFGPILPMIGYDDFEETVKAINKMPKPLAFYLFSENKDRIKTVTTTCLYGGGCINDTIIHLATSEMGFGGVHESGMGSYHGKNGFDAFSHIKSIVDKKTWLDLPMRYRPFKGKANEKLIRFFLK